MKAVLALIVALLWGDVAHAAERRFTLSAFDKIRIEGDVAVDIASGTSPFAIASGDPGALATLDIKVQGGTLYIRRTRRNVPVEQRNRIASQVGVPLISINARTIVALAVLGHGSARLDRLAGSRPSVTMDGNGSVQIGSLDADSLTINLNGSGSMALAGKATAARAVMLGDGQIEGSDLSLERLEFIGEGPVRGQFTVNGPARIAVKGDADIQIGGNPACTIRQTGNNAIRCGGEWPSPL